MAISSGQVFSVGDDARLRGGIALGQLIHLQRRGAGHGELVDVGANSRLQLSMSSKVTIWPVWAAMRPIEVTRLASAPRFTSL